MTFCYLINQLGHRFLGKVNRKIPNAKIRTNKMSQGNGEIGACTKIQVRACQSLLLCHLNCRFWGVSVECLPRCSSTLGKHQKCQMFCLSMCALLMKEPDEGQEQDGRQDRSSSQGHLSCRWLFFMGRPFPLRISHSKKCDGRLDYYFQLKIYSLYYSTDIGTEFQ